MKFVYMKPINSLRMEKRKNTAIPTTLEVQETKTFELNTANEMETVDILTEKGARYLLVDKSKNGAKVYYKFYDSTGKGFKDVFDRIIENSKGAPRLYFFSEDETAITVKRL